ncbi:hypothetical protein AVEN_127996-1 [Araneus ventricosus]|uniref:Uncharacterized protein n=1 Tax=Araneus ventricosus TaxID=182803 RepID=A0A4Y2A081_ARAVE|nr:hypothetical protein AVEN_127996-1 [Araneus ventricosus]
MIKGDRTVFLWQSWRHDHWLMIKSDRTIFLWQSWRHDHWLMILSDRTSYMSRSEDLWLELGYFLIFLQLLECRISCNDRRTAISVRVHHAPQYMDFMFGKFHDLSPLASRTRKMQIIPSANGFPLRL